MIYEMIIHHITIDTQYFIVTSNRKKFKTLKTCNFRGCIFNEQSKRRSP